MRITPGETRVIVEGEHVGALATVARVEGERVTANALAWGERVELTRWPEDLGPPYAPTRRDFGETLARFAEAYERSAPARHRRLRPGLAPERVRAAWASRGFERLPDDYVRLYEWRDGFAPSPDPWHDEFATDAWHERAPLDDEQHWPCLECALAHEATWRETRSTAGEARRTHFRAGFLPLTRRQSWGYVVIDTRGYLGGRPGQVISFDFKSSDGFSFFYEGVDRWLETMLAQLEAGVLFGRDAAERHEAERLRLLVNGDYRHRFPPAVPLADP
jgi:hypothetical protein